MNRAEARAVQVLLAAVKDVGFDRAVIGPVRFLADRSSELLGDGIRAADLTESTPEPDAPTRPAPRSQPVKTSRADRRKATS